MDIDQKHPYHSIEIEETFEKVSADKKGLSSDEAKKRQEEFGKNKLPEKKGVNPILLFLKQFKDFLILILFIAAGIAFWAEKMTDVYIIIAVILFNGIMGFIQEYKAEKAIEAIKGLDQKHANVLRDGNEEEIDAEDVVPGDIIILKEGNSIPADGRIFEAKELRTTEASLTGESMPVDKNQEPVEKNASLGDRLNIAFKSTNVVNGKGKAVVTAIGNQTEIGKIAKSMGEMEMQDSNFKKKTKLLGKQMAAIAIVTSLIVFALGYWFQDYEFQETLLVTIAVLVSIIPEGLPAVISIVLAIGANRMAVQNVIIREFTATEMMGSVSVILVDKTGTLTQSILVIKKMFTGSGKEVEVTGTGYQLEGEFKVGGEDFEIEKNPVEQKLLAIAAFCNDAHIMGQNKVKTDSDKGSSPDQKEEKDNEKDQKESGEKTDKSREIENQMKESKEQEETNEERKEEDIQEGQVEAQQNKDRQEEKQNEGLELSVTEKEDEDAKEEKSKKVGKETAGNENRAESKPNKEKDQKMSEREPGTSPESDKVEDKPEKEEKQEKGIDVDVDVQEDKVKISVNLKTEKRKKSSDESDEDEIEEEEEEEEDQEEEENEEKDQGPEMSGDPTEVAMFVIGKKAKIQEKEPFAKYSLLDEIPFKSENKFRASLVETEEGVEIFAIGAPEKILELSTEYLTPDGPRNMGDEKRQEIQDKMGEWADDAMRVLALGFKKSEGKEEINTEDVKDLVWVGITGIIDPPRKGVKESVKECKTAGIRVVMVTGDHKKTAAAIARDVGILTEEDEKRGGKYPSAMTTQELDVEDEKFDEYINHVNVFARMNPDTKLRIAERLQAKDTLIAMTGDGVNDAPALKRADVGIAMGRRGTDVAKDASEIVLQDDNFSSIVNAIREGRIVFNNVRITSYFLLSTNFAFGLAFIISMALDMPLLLTAAQILYVNLVTAGIVDIALATEPGHGEIMEQPPVKKSEKILKWDIVPFLLVVSAVIVTLTLLTFQYYLPEGEEMARTATFIMVSMSQIFNVFNMRSLRKSIFEIGPFTNRWVNYAFIGAIVLQLLVIKLPFLRDLMAFENLPIVDFVVISLIAIVIVGAGELYKYLKFKKNLF